MTPIPMWSGERSRRIIQRIVVEGDLVLQTPAHFGTGDGDDLCDMPLLLDSREEAEGSARPLLTGASIAGALRSYLRQREKGFRAPLPDPRAKSAAKLERESHAAVLFGAFKGDDEGEQSPLIVDDALGKPETFGFEMRDGVGIHPKSRTAAENKLYDLQLWRAGTTFPLRFESVIREGDDETTLKRALATALGGFNDQEYGITLGARKRRGYGRAKVEQWSVKCYDLSDRSGLLAWIGVGRDDLGITAPTVKTGDNLAALLGVSLLDDARHLFTLSAKFWLDGALLIRSGSGQDDAGPDAVHLHSVRPDSSRDKEGNPIPDPILSGTSLAGALRARALKIAKTLGDERKAIKLVEQMFGPEMKSGVKPAASKVEVEEHVVRVPAPKPGEVDRTRLVQNRVSIDRFTGGARDTALFNEQPLFGGTDTEVTVEVRLPDPRCCEIGLLLLLLKDLWTRDLPLGGESSVGRGRLKGKRADLRYKATGSVKTWTIIEKPDGSGLLIEQHEAALMEGYVQELNNHLKEETK